MDYKFTGSVQDIAIASKMIADKANTLTASEFALYKKQVDISPKIFSKLKVIGERLIKFNSDELQVVLNQLPQAYSAIHILCQLTKKEMLAGAQSGAISPSMSVRSARLYVNQIKYPTQSSPDGEKGLWGYKQEHLFNIVRPENIQLSEEVVNQLQNDLRKICIGYGVKIQTANPTDTTTLRQLEREEKAGFWRSILKKEITEKWFYQSSTQLRDEFNLNTLNDLFDSSIRTFTGFITRTGVGKANFKKVYGKPYLAKLHILSEVTEDIGQRYNYRKRIQQLLDENQELKIWNDLVLKDGGFIK